MLDKVLERKKQWFPAHIYPSTAKHTYWKGEMQSVQNDIKPPWQSAIQKEELVYQDNSTVH